MRIMYFTVYGSSTGHSAVELNDGSELKINFTEEESVQLRSLAERIIEKRQSAIAAEVAKPFIALANYSEV